MGLASVLHKLFEAQPGFLMGLWTGLATFSSFPATNPSPANSLLFVGSKELRAAPHITETSSSLWRVEEECFRAAAASLNQFQYI